eukprot:scaffold338_cov116-Cylindrotheca_fusiformis.AAC.22
MAARLHDGVKWVDVADTEYTSTGSHVPMIPILNGDGKIFVSIPNYRGYEIYDKQNLRKDTTKVIVKDKERRECPRVDQIRKLSVHHYAAMGPTWARALGRKILGNEEFCLQIDAHMKFVQDWDEKVKEEWSGTKNEFGIISAVPMGMYDLENTPATTVLRGCEVEMPDIGIPHFNDRGDGKVENLKQPLLAHSWSSGFSFAKCHLEESAPYDPFTPYVMGAENFARFARFWTRGYDVYTPTQNIVYHNYQPNPDGHGMNEWMHPRFTRFREDALKRIRTYLGAPDGLEDFNLSNLGIYGLGKRRTLKQLEEFMKIQISTKTGRPEGFNVFLQTSCLGDEWVPYDMNISPTENLYDDPDNLNPQPEYPLRTKLTFYEEEDVSAESIEVPRRDLVGHSSSSSSSSSSSDETSSRHHRSSPFPSASLLIPLWLLGLVVWFMFFGNPQVAKGQQSSSSGKKNKAGPKDK